jgi:hypothetical protein
VKRFDHPSGQVGPIQQAAVDIGIACLNALPERLFGHRWIPQLFEQAFFRDQARQFLDARVRQEGLPLAVRYARMV